MIKNSVEQIEVAGRKIDAGGFDWATDPRFPGVLMKHLIPGYDTGGRFSAHLMRVTSGSQLGDQVHPAQSEMCQVIEGSGYGWIGGERVEYTPGTRVLIPAGTFHNLAANGSELILLTTFVPALI